MTHARPTDAGAIEAAAADWLARRDGSAWTAGDDAELAIWLDADVAHRVAFLRLQAVWAETARLQALGAGHVGAGMPPRVLRGEAGHTFDEPAALRFAPRASPPRRRHGLWIGAALAACLALVAGGAWFVTVPIDPVDVRTATGITRTVALADGSQTTLASDTAIEVRMSRRERRIALTAGEAFFEAAKDPQRPFVVEAGDRRVVAVGTRFSVRRERDALRVVVTEGTVRLEPLGDDIRQPTTLLPAGSVATVRRDAVLVRSLSLAEVEELVDWRSGRLVFRDTALTDAVAEFNRFNTRQIVIADTTVGALRIGGSFRWENAEGFVRLLERGFPVEAEYGRERIVLRAP
ncbi:FecR domain-containing protein [Luteimonas sp. SMYT11W]|uniref:FecR domain-containing protein n=1 Tax=Luteimonas flava TaxID=3115822 RepID=A0ABU7WES6_9GAMM